MGNFNTYIIIHLQKGKKVFMQVLDALKTETPQYSEYFSQWETELQIN
jgi:hypothetical protein